MRHEDMCYIDDCIYCHPDQQPYREAKAIQKTLTSEYSTEGVKECTKDWKKKSPNYECHLCQATAETPKRKDVTSRKTFNTNKWFRKCINSWSEQDKENCKGATKKDEDEHKTFVMICAPCMSGRWEVIEPNKWKTAMMDMNAVATHTNRVWHRKINDEIDAYNNTVNTQIETALKDKKKPGLKTERDRKRTQEFVRRDKMHKRLKTLYEYNLADPDDQKIEQYGK
eukprot:scaffold9496_cov40-Attheya_sp.AAC.4